jgi:nucleotide-binding universal stress UspA family protein
MDIKKILVPVVFLDASLRVTQQATYLARHFHAEIILVHVVTPLSYSAALLEGGAREFQDEVVRRAKEDLEESLQGEFEGITVRRLLLRGHPASEIVKTARSENADLIVMSTHGRGPFYRLLLGSVTAKVLHQSESAVWTGAHLEEAPPGEFALRHILCAVNLNEHAVHTLRQAAQLADEFKARLTVAHVTGGVEMFGPGGPRVEPEWKEELVNDASKEIAKLQQEAGTQAEVIVESGNAPALLARVAERIHADLLIVGRTPPGGHLGEHGDAYSIIRDARIPVLSM